MPRETGGSGQGCRVDVGVRDRKFHGWMSVPAPRSRTRSIFRCRRRRADRALWLAHIGEDRRELVRFWPVIQNMVVGELRVRYQRSMMGFVWTLLNPLLMMVILSLVFSHLLNEGDRATIPSSCSPAWFPGAF